jgi:hypothetical protein
MIWGSAATLMTKSKPLALVVYLSFGGFLLFLCFYLMTWLKIFVWLVDVSLVVFVGIGVLGAVVNVRDYFFSRREPRDKQGTTVFAGASAHLECNRESSM